MIYRLYNYMKRSFQAGDNMNEDNTFISKVVNGDRQAYGLIIEKYGSRLYGFIYKIIGDESDSLDIVQETFLKAYENLNSFNVNKSFVTWLFTIAKNTTFNHIKAKKRYLSRYKGDDVEKAGGTAAVDYQPEEKFIKNTENAKLIRAISSLPEKYKVLICLKYIEGLSYKEIGNRLKLKESLVESRIFTARQKLIAFMKEVE